MTAPYDVDVISREHDNIAGIVWGFTVWVALRRTNRYSVGVSYHTNEPPTPRFRTYYPLKTASEIWEAISAQHRLAAEWEAPLCLEDAREVCKKLAEADPVMAEQLLAEADRRLAPVASGRRHQLGLESADENAEKHHKLAGTGPADGAPPKRPPSSLTDYQREALKVLETRYGRSLTTQEMSRFLAETEMFQP